MRAPACVARVVNWETWLLSGGVPTGPVACKTPSARPMKETGTQTAEQAPPGRSRSFGQALRLSLVSNTTGFPRRTATQENGDDTGQAGAPEGGLVAARSRGARLEAGSSSSLGQVRRNSSHARPTALKGAGFLSGHFHGPLN